MKDYGFFDIMGPIMIGPSSSHTAGACRIGNMGRNISGREFDRVDFILHGSFAATYKGHGTDRALLAGAMGLKPEDERLRDSFALAEAQGLKYRFLTADLGVVHPNTAKIVFYYPDGSSFYIVGSSIGGGNIEIIDINGVEVSLTDKNPTIILKYIDAKGIIAFISTTLSENNYNIESMRTVKIGQEVTMILETSEDVEERVLKILSEDERFIFFKYVPIL